jgi:hypothetical protein
MRHYRKIWVDHYGPIPKDKNGRTYEIHHIDGDNTNNKIGNLKCISIEEHYKIHYEQGDYAACLRIMTRMKLAPEEKSNLAKLSNKKRFLENNHPFIDPLVREKIKQRTSEKIADGTFIFLKGNYKKEWTMLAQKHYNERHDRSKLVKQSWIVYNSQNPNNKRTIAGSQAGTMKVKNTKWYHKLDGTQLRTQETDLRIKQEGWILGRFNGSELMKNASSKYSHKGKKKSEETKTKTKETNLGKTLTRFKKETIKEALEKTSNLNQAVYYFNNHFGNICYPTLVKMKKYYQL